MTLKFELEPAEVDFVAARMRAGKMDYTEALAVHSILMKMENQANDKVKQGTARLEKSPTVTKLPGPPQVNMTSIAKAAEAAVIQDEGPTDVQDTAAAA